MGSNHSAGLIFNEKNSVKHLAEFHKTSQNSGHYCCVGSYACDLICKFEHDANATICDVTLFLQ